MLWCFEQDVLLQHCISRRDLSTLVAVRYDDELKIFFFCLFSSFHANHSKLLAEWTLTKWLAIRFYLILSFLFINFFYYFFSYIIIIIFLLLFLDCVKIFILMQIQKAGSEFQKIFTIIFTNLSSKLKNIRKKITDGFIKQVLSRVFCAINIKIK